MSPRAIQPKRVFEPKRRLAAIKTNSAIVEMTVEIKDKRQLEKVTGAIRRIPGVRDIERVQ